MTYLNNSRTAMVDIDDTILLWEPDKYIHNKEDLITIEANSVSKTFLPHAKNIEFIKALKLQGYGIVFWSASGPEWCQKIVTKLGLEEVANVIMGKPELAMDDLLDAKRIIKSVIWIDPNTGEYKRNV